MRVVLVVLLALPALAAPSKHPAADAARLVEAALDERFAAQWSAAAQSPDALTRATAARVATVRDYKDALPVLRRLVATETEPVARREVLRALVLLGDDADLDQALAVAQPADESVILDAAARRGGEKAINPYLEKLRKLRAGPGDYFLTALWHHEGLIPQTANALLLLHDERSWRALLSALTQSELALPAETAAKALGSNAEELRVATVWYLAHGYSADPGRLPEAIKPLVLADPGPQSDREAFGRELLRRMLGQPAKDDDRWLKWLATKEADDLLREKSQISLYFTIAEMKLREDRCAKFIELTCTFAPRGTKTIPSKPVRQPEFMLPGTLPAGLTQQIIEAERCNGEWLGVASATVDTAGRVQSINLKDVRTSCPQPLSIISRLSLVDTPSIRAPLSSGDILLVKPNRVLPCLDELPAGDDALHRTGGEVTAPVVKKRVEPEFPQSARVMGAGHEVMVVVEAVITRSGCVRSVRLITQAPFPALNASALMAMSKWQFDPGRLNGQPVDVVFNLTIRFLVR
jgi:TonB family protein